MPSIAEKYRPRTLADFIASPDVLTAVHYWIARGLGGLAFWIAGPTGTGKTTLARILAAQVADPMNTEEFDSADQLTNSELHRVANGLHCTGFGRGGRAVIVNEAHGLSRSAVRQLLGVTEPIPSHATWIFTTTHHGQANLIDGIDGQPLIDRCKQIPLNAADLGPAFQVRFLEIAAAEGFDVSPFLAAELLRKNKYSLRAALEWLGTPASMPYLKTAAVVAA